MADPIKVTVSDPNTGEVLGEQVIEDDYVLICAGRTHVASTQIYAIGTHVVTIKNAAGKAPHNASQAVDR